MVDRALMDYVLLPIRIGYIVLLLPRVLDVNMYRGEGGGMSDHILVEARLKVVCGWRSAGKMEGVGSVLKESELNRSVKKRGIP